MKIFLAYGNAKTLTDEVSELLLNLGHEVVDLAEAPNRGGTVIEKLESNSEVDKAVVLLTGDDAIKPYKGRKIIRCARQNVIFELGYFVARSGRENVIIVSQNKDVTQLLTHYPAAYIKVDAKLERNLIKEIKNHED